MDQGYSSKAACRAVGINKKTGQEWRNGPSKRKRMQPIADWRRQGWGVRRIAAAMKRSPSAISREPARNGHHRSGDYRSHTAHARAMERLPRPKRGKIAQNPELRSYIQDKLDQWWSPEQIARVPRRQAQKRNPRYRDPTVMISERPAEVEDPATRLSVLLDRLPV